MYETSGTRIEMKPIGDMHHKLLVSEHITPLEVGKYSQESTIISIPWYEEILDTLYPQPN